jgi:hypothetical protein
MALNWSIENVENWKALAESEEERAITDRLVWATLAVELGSIEPKNIGEWMVRLRALEAAGFPLFEGGEAGVIPAKREWLVRRIGLRTNVFPGKTRKAFEAKLGRMVVERAERELRAVAAA